MAAADAAPLKKPASSYWLWLGDHRDEVVKALGGVKKGSDVAKKAGEMWKALDASARAPYEEKGKVLKAAYDAAKPEKVEKPVVEKNPDTARPPSAYWLWLGANREEIVASLGGVKKGSEVSKKAGEMWKDVPASARAPFEEKAKALKDAYLARAATDEGKAALAEKKEEQKAAKEAKRAKEDKKAAKLARKEKKEGGGAADSTDEAAAEPESPEAEVTPSKVEKTPKKAGRPKKDATPKAAAPKKDATPKAAAGKRKAESPEAAAPAPKAAKRSPSSGKGRPPARKEPPAPEIDAKVMQKAEKMGVSDSGVTYKALLSKLMGSDGIMSNQAGDALKALEKSGGLLNKARNQLQATVAGA